MKNSKFHPTARIAGALLVLFMAIYSGFALWSNAQSQGQGRPAPDRELARLAIEQPVQFSAEVDRLKTEEEKLEDEWSAFAILNPAEFEAEVEKLKTPVERQQQAAARAAVLDPARHSGPVEELRQQMRLNKGNSNIPEIHTPRQESEAIPE